MSDKRVPCAGKVAIAGKSITMSLQMFMLSVNKASIIIILCLRYDRHISVHTLLHLFRAAYSVDVERFRPLQ